MKIMDELRDGQFSERSGWLLVIASGVLPALLGLAFDFWR